MQRDSLGRFLPLDRVIYKIEELREDFYSHVEVAEENECWLWKDGKTGLGYGQYCYNGKIVYAHRFAWMLEHGDIPKGKEILHECDRPSCVNPKHLEAGTHQKNMLDKFIRGENRNPRGEKHGSAKLTDDKIRDIRFLYATGEYSQRTLGDLFNISNRNVSSIVNLETWRHV